MYCLICGQSSSNFRDKRSKINYFECSECQFIMKSPENFCNFTTQKERYNLHTNNEDDAGYRAYFQKFIDFLEIETKSTIHRALDFGCGASLLLSKMLTSESIPCDAYDPIYHQDEVYQKRSYDLILSVEVFEHLHNPKSIFAMLTERLNRGGYLAIQTAFHPNDREAFLRWYYHLDPTHVIFFTPKTFEVLAGRFGLEILKCDEKSMVLLRQKS